ncbi:MAG: hypothetical protein Q7U92_20095 [Bradyrhizobium sp.]|nr:hypothetical protein [Bradyrhizobium sp.]
MRLLSLAGLAICLSAGSTVLQPAHAANLVLITADEAKLPPPKGAIAMSARGVTRGPKVELVPQAGAIRSPVRLQFKFQTYGGSKVDLDAVQATYLRTPNVDLTPRIKPFVNATGIDVPAAELPPGDHMVRIDIMDSEGRTATANIVLKVEQ